MRTASTRYAERITLSAILAIFGRIAAHGSGESGLDPEISPMPERGSRDYGWGESPARAVPRAPRLQDDRTYDAANARILNRSFTVNRRNYSRGVQGRAVCPPPVKGPPRFGKNRRLPRLV